MFVSVAGGTWHHSRLRGVLGLGSLFLCELHILAECKGVWYMHTQMCIDTNMFLRDCVSIDQLISLAPSPSLCLSLSVRPLILARNEAGQNICVADLQQRQPD